MSAHLATVRTHSLPGCATSGRTASISSWKYRDFGVFGLGYVGGPSCVVSTHRLGHSDRPRFFDRLKKIVVHELGHNRALPHCTDTACVMRDAVERMSSIDAAAASFCAVCLQRLGGGKPSAR